MAWRRRAFLRGGCGCVVALAGCVTADPDDTAGTDDETNASEEETTDPAAADNGDSDSTGTENSTESSGGADSADPEGSTQDDSDAVSRNALSNVIARVADADDPEAVAEQYDIEYRDGEVRVLVQLEPDGTRPDEHISEVITELDGAVIAWVRVDAVVTLSENENVRSVRPVPAAEPHG